MITTAGILLALLPAPVQDGGDRPYLEAAREAARWLASVAVETEHGLRWPPDPARPEGESDALYSGSAGVVLFLLELGRATGDAAYGEQARKGADHLLARLPEELGETPAGLYTGIAGIGFTLLQAHRATGEERYAEGARRCVALLHGGAREAEGGVEWNDSTDVVYGSAGIGFFLMYAADHLEDPASLKLTTRAGRRLLVLARRDEEAQTLHWPMTPTFPRLMPNYSHGTAGVAAFLATLHGETGEEAFLHAALAGARTLLGAADTEGEGFRLFHHEPGGEELYYLGWCHGPSGTARLFQILARVTGDGEWEAWVARCGDALLASGIPAERPPGFWNNVGQCCGSAGVASFLLQGPHGENRERYVALARELTRDLLERGTRDGSGLRWVHAEHRVRPELLQAQTGYMQGAAGIGLWLLQLDAFEQGGAERLRLPDDPFP